MKSTFLRVLALFMILGLGLLSGCATPPDDESDLPWNTPESWEGSPYIPGMNQ